MRYLFVLLSILTQLLPLRGNCYYKNIEVNQQANNRIDSLLQILNTPTDSYIMVVAHRGDWTNAPENSLQAIKNAIEIGVDILEIDVRFTKDKVPVVIHDKTLNRTTTGSGKISRFTLNDLKGIFLTDKHGKPTSHKIPTLDEALLLSKGKILINLDKCTMHLDKIVKHLYKTNTLNQIIIKKRDDFYKINLQKKCFKNRLIYIPQIIEKNKKLEHHTNKFIKKYKPLVFDINLTENDSLLLPLINKLKQNFCRIWVSTTANENVRNYNNREKSPNSETKWGWAIDFGANIIVTDEPKLLIEYLKEKKLRKNIHLKIQDEIIVKSSPAK
ncbi:glycerophosphodiester phosphodiesterase family protein [Ancylomarina euxinus]|nr:glycerophosphodiester phosphodiesterase family protein [Ancylomarina euxinus]MCZ4693982.1 glycerophosphodiester phosphodiesterase family protein [Ancylomarina euxinus]